MIKKINKDFLRIYSMTQLIPSKVISKTALLLYQHGKFYREVSELCGIQDK